MRTNQTPAKTATCRRCRATLTAQASVAQGIGAALRRVEAATEGLNAAQQAKALELVADNGVTPVRGGVYQVTSADGSATYLTAVTGQCTCAWGCRRTSAMAKTCYHVAAVKLTARPRLRLAA